MKKLTLLIVAGAGYVLGSRAGRERYDQIKNQASKTWNSPTVQDAVDEVQTHAKQAGADLSHKAGSKVADTAATVKDRVTEKVSSHDTSHEQPSTIAPGQGTS